VFILPAVNRRLPVIFYCYRYLAVTITGGKFQKISPKFKIFKEIHSVISGLPVGLPIPLNGGNCFTAGKANPGAHSGLAETSLLLPLNFSAS
jgi:hypothetical protein